MRGAGTFLGLAVGLGVGAAATFFSLGSPKPLGAASNDRYGEYVMATGAVSINPRVQTDGVWMLDYRSGKLLGTVIDKTQGKIVGWAEVDLTGEFGVKAYQDVHFMMTTGYVTQGQSALYVAETTTGKFGVYTMGPGVNGQGIVIRRHDQTSFRNVVATTDAAPTTPPAPGAIPAAPTTGLPAPIAPGVPTMTAPASPLTVPVPAAPSITPPSIPAPVTAPKTVIPTLPPPK
jgi:hypothetical protein